MSDYIPEDIVADVLLRLPIDSLLRFRCVSKSWRRLIDSSDFVKMHFRAFSVKPKSNQDLKIVALSERGTFSALEFDPNNCSVASAKQLNYPPNMISNNQGSHVVLQLIGSCNGLLCLTNSNGEILLWNPWIQKHWQLPSPPIAYSLGTQVSSRLGFGYVQFNDDYKIVNFLKLFEIFEEESAAGQDEVHVYSLKLNSWRRIGEFPWKFPEHQPDVGAFANGALHWIVKKRQWEVNNFIVSFDLKNEQFRQVMVCPRQPHDAFEQHLRILDGNLCVLSYYYFAGRYRVDLSEMKEYGVETSWTKLVSIKMPYDIHSLWSLTPITYLKSGRGELVIQIERDKLVTCDPSTYYMENVRIVGSAASSLASCVCLGSLVQPCGGGAGDG